MLLAIFQCSFDYPGEALCPIVSAASNQPYLIAIALNAQAVATGQDSGLKVGHGCPYHNLIDDECCPDFSCCVPRLFESNAEKRWKFYDKFYTESFALFA
jgi:hypothetical protein